ncbi:MAG TPA: winged helix DNA-binding domain-containing protein [Propionibacteriaceae bacterium]
MDRIEALTHRIHAQQLDREADDSPVTEAAILDFGIQDTGRDGASWALANRGFPVPNPASLEQDQDLALVWTLRSSPHYYRRSELFDVLTATSPYSEDDATKRVFGAGQPLQAVGISTLDGLREVAKQLRAVVTKPLVKGEVSTRLSARLDEPYLRDCVPCNAHHSWEIPFRNGALYAGLELEPGTSPPVLRRIPGWPRRAAGPADDPDQAPDHLQPIRNYLRFLGPATPQDVAAFLDGPVAVVKAHWPEDAVEVDVDGHRGWMLPGDPPPAVDSGLVRLLGGYDPLMQAKDRALIVPDKSRHKALWPTLGRPGAVLVGTEVVGTWRPKATAKAFTLRLELWDKISRSARKRLEAEGERLAGHRGRTWAGIEEA